MKEYIIRGGAGGRERLALLSRAMKPYTNALLDDAGLFAGAHVLDVGCGGGDVTREIADRVGAKGRAVGIDMDPVEIGIAREEASSLGLSNIEYRVGDVLSEAIEDRFDLVYARFLLSHLAHPEHGIARMIACLKPGGLLVVEDVDFRGHFCHPPRESFTRYVSVYEKAARKRGVDPHLGAQLPSLLMAAGTSLEGARVVCPAAVNGPIKEMAAATLAAIAEAVVKEGFADRQTIEADVADLAEAAKDESVFMSMPRIVQCWARAG